VKIFIIEINREIFYFFHVSAVGKELHDRYPGAKMIKGMTLYVIKDFNIRKVNKHLIRLMVDFVIRFL